MRSPAKTLVTMLLTATVAAGAGALARANTEGGEPAGMSAPRRGAGATLAAAKTGKAPAASKLAPARPQRARGGSRAGRRGVAPARCPANAAPRRARTHRPLRCGHRALRNLTLAEEDAACCARPFRPGQRQARRSQGLRDRIKDPAARKLVDWFIFRGGYGTATEITRLSGGQSGLARPQPAHPARRGGPVQQSLGKLSARSRPSSPARNPRPALALPRWRAPILADKDNDAPRRSRSRPGRSTTSPPARSRPSSSASGRS